MSTHQQEPRPVGRPPLADQVIWSKEVPRIQAMIVLGATVGDIAAAYNLSMPSMAAVMAKLGLRTIHGQLKAERRERINRLEASCGRLAA